VPYLVLLLAFPGRLAPKRGATNQLTVGVVMQANIKSSIEHASPRPLQIFRVVAEEPNAGVAASSSRRRACGNGPRAFQLNVVVDERLRRLRLGWSKALRYPSTDPQRHCPEEKGQNRDTERRSRHSSALRSRISALTAVA
jgi:hypothetical protein